MEESPPRPPSPPSPPHSLQPSPPDARSASQVSLVPAVTDAAKRTLLLVYIHGFMGDESSFHAFPAHLHNLLCLTLAPLDYLVHTKVYPKFKTRHHILSAVEAFSRWLSPFECRTTDVVLLGHSMGGILSAEAVLLLDGAGQSRHRILGIVSFDTPFLGMHPGIITAGIGSLFRGSPPSQSAATDGFFSQTPQRNFSVAVRKPPEGPWESTLHFIDKHHTHLTYATTQYLLSHLEFGACLADPMGLTQRYVAVRRVKMGFVNYYTASTGRTKDPPTYEEEAALEAKRRGKEMRELEKLVRAQEKEKEKAVRRKEKEAQKEEKGKEKKKAKEEKEKEKEKVKEEKEKSKGGSVEEKEKEKQTEEEEPQPDSKAEHEPAHDHEKQELARLRREEARMEAESFRMNGVPEIRLPTPSLPEYEQSAGNSDENKQGQHDEGEQEKYDGDEQEKYDGGKQEQHDKLYTKPPKLRERRFCILPWDAEQNSWVKVPMAGVDEVGAHCSLFVPGPVYEQLVGDVAGRLEAWVGEEVSRRVAEMLM